MRVKDKLSQLGLTPRKGLGQNFLIDQAVIDQIEQFGNGRVGEHIVEIGPGLGALTERLVQHESLTVIEIESSLCHELAKRFPGIEIINADVRQVNFAEIGSELVVFGNLPYSFSTEILFHLLGQAECLSRAVLMLQKEFVERMAAPPGCKAYGTLSIGCQLRSDVRLGPVITGDSFHPPAGVDSRLVELTFLKDLRYPVSDQLWFQRVVKASFCRRRKKLINSLTASGIFSKGVVEQALSDCAIDQTRRAETLSVAEFVVLADRLRS